MIALRLGVFENACMLGGCEAQVERHQHRAEAREREQQHQHLGTVVAEIGDAIACGNAEVFGQASLARTIRCARSP